MTNFLLLAIVAILLIIFLPTVAVILAVVGVLLFGLLVYAMPRKIACTPRVSVPNVPRVRTETFAQVVARLERVK